MSEVIIYYHLYNKKRGTIDLSCLGEKEIAPLLAKSEVEPKKPDVSKRQLRVSDFFLKASRITAIAGIVLVLFFYGPKAFAWGKDFIGSAAKNFGITVSEVNQIKNSKNTSKSAYTPALDPTLSKANKLMIPSIGVNTDIQEATLDNYVNALKNGVWRVSDFGEPTDNSEPIILAAHRYGYLAWTNTFRHLNSFYNLPKVKVGDTVEIDWKQSKYTYEVYAMDENTEITDYSADLILYTCESLTGEERIFVYARLIVT